MKLTAKEQSLIGKEIVFETDVSYGGVFGIVRKGTKATIVDFAIQSGDPVVQIEYTDTKVIAPFEVLVFTLCYDK